jgi:hypothetical protein
MRAVIMILIVLLLLSSYYMLAASQWGGGGRCACFTVAFAEGHAAQLEQYEVSTDTSVYSRQTIINLHTYTAATFCRYERLCSASQHCSAGMQGCVLIDTCESTLGQLCACNIVVAGNCLHCVHVTAAVVANTHLMLYWIVTNTSSFFAIDHCYRDAIPTAVDACHLHHKLNSTQLNPLIYHIHQRW